MATMKPPLSLRRAAALRAGDQGYGAVVLRGNDNLGEAPSRVVTAGDPTAQGHLGPDTNSPGKPLSPTGICRTGHSATSAQPADRRIGRWHAFPGSMA